MFSSGELIAAAAVSFLLGWTGRKAHIFYPLTKRLNLYSQPANVKFVIVVRSDLRMSTGKIASQCSHATLACYKQGLKFHPEVLKQWETHGEPTMVLRTNSGEEGLRELGKKAADAGLVAALIRDAGRTQVSAGSPTALGIGPDCVDKINQLTSGLKLF